MPKRGKRKYIPCPPAELVWAQYHPEKKADFLTFHAKHKYVWEMFCEFTFKIMKRGFQHYGARIVIDKIRYTLDMERGDDGFEINDKHISIYARWFMLKHDCWGFFETRRVKGTNIMSKEERKRRDLGGDEEWLH